MTGHTSSVIGYRKIGNKEVLYGDWFNKSGYRMVRTQAVAR